MSSLHDLFLIRRSCGRSSPWRSSVGAATPGSRPAGDSWSLGVFTRGCGRV